MRNSILGEVKVCSFVELSDQTPLKHIILIMACGLFFLPAASAQFSTERTAMNNLGKGKWDKARGQFLKAIRKDTLNAVARYGLATYFFTEANPAFQIDSAYYHVQQALSDYAITDPREKDRMKRFPLDSSLLVQLRMQIDSAAFERAKDQHTEQAYVFFLDNFLYAVQRDRATELRDEVAFLDALKENTYQSFLSYLTKYPKSARAGEASSRYHKLLYEAKTQDKTLKSYTTFLTGYPETPYRAEVERQIFELSTASGEINDFQQFMAGNLNSSMNKKAAAILYHLLKDNNLPIPSYLMTDSLKKVEVLERQFLILFLQDNQFGFMNSEGEVIIKPRTTELKNNYLCGNITDDILVFNDQVVTRNGTVIYKGLVDEVDDLGFGFVSVSSKNCVMVVHKSGWQVTPPCIEDAKLINNHFLAIKQNGKWALWTLTGRELIAPEWTDIDDEGDVIIFRGGPKLFLTHRKNVAKIANRESLVFTVQADEVKMWRKGVLWIKKGGQEGTLDENLKEWIPLAKHELTPESFGAIAKSSDGTTLHYWPGRKSKTFQSVKQSKPWVAGKEPNGWRLVDTSLKIMIEALFDSVSFVGPFALGTLGDSTWVYFNAANYLHLTAQARLQFIPGKDSLFFLLIEEGDKKNLYDGRGNKLLNVDYDRIEYTGDGYLGITKRDKRGILSVDGKVVVQPEYDAIGNVVNGKVSVLRNKKFGMLDVNKRLEIKPVYDKNIVPYNEQYLVACKAGLCGLIDWDNKPVTGLEYEAIQFWTDSVALVKKNFQWLLYNFIDRKITLDKIRKFEPISDGNEIVLIILHDNNYGVISNRKGEVIPTTFSDVINLGSAIKPFYFTEKHVEEASIVVVIYYNHRGELIRKQVFESEDYERIVCSD
jgi:hypothetical protein